MIINSFSFSSYVYSEVTTLSINVSGLSQWPSIIYSLVVNIPNLIGSVGSYCTSGITNLVCALFQPTNTLTVSMSDSTALPLNIAFTIMSLTAPVVGSPAQYFTLTTFDNSNYAVQTDNSTIVFSNNCSVNCRTCLSNDSSVCLSCYSTSNATLL